MKQIALALHNYHDEHGAFPPAYIADANGQPMHSWRVLILPYLEQADLYKQYRFDEPWNGPNNRKLASKIPAVFRCPSFGHHHEHAGGKPEAVAHVTHYVAVRGLRTVFPGTRGVGRDAIVDGSSNTILIVETVGKPVHWMAPDDISPQSFVDVMSNADTGGHHAGNGAHVALADGSVRWMTFGVRREILQGLLTIAGGEQIGDTEW